MGGQSRRIQPKPRGDRCGRVARLGDRDLAAGKADDAARVGRRTGCRGCGRGAVSMPPISPRRSGSKLPSDPQAVSASTASMAQPVRISRLVMVLSSACLVVAGGHVWPNPSTSGTNRTCRNSS
ncbi:hypothetical protein [Paracoccus sp. NBH48]|uniref:hypothetical protein n=1 Tax=Paracoccus sp. NBH48 TaxID=2596918 RepID=UPI00351C29F3